MQPFSGSRPDAGAKGPARAHGEGGPDGWTLDEIMEAVVRRAPEALRRRVLLQAVDWTRIDGAQVGAMLASFAGQKQSAPRWLVKALLLAGHPVPDAAIGTAPPAWRALNRLNGAMGDGGPGKGIDPEALAALPHSDADIGRAVVARLALTAESGEAQRLALALWPQAPEALTAARGGLASFLDRAPLLRVRLAGLSTTSLFAADLAHAFGGEGCRAVVTQSEFGQAAATLVSPDPEADVHALLLDMDSLAPADWRQSATENRRRLLASAETLVAAFAAYAERASAPLLVNTIPVPAAPTAGLLDRRHEAGLRRVVDEVNARLLEAAERWTQIVIVDADLALADIPLSRHSDPKLWFYGRIAWSADAIRLLAAAFARAWGLMKRGPAKALALDFDNTLWGGIYGDDGAERLACGEDYPGNAFLALQQECLRLKSQGLLLVALSKNNPDAMTVFDRHPGMALRPGDFSAAAINWRPKAENIRRLAADLNIGLDSFLFLDDSPHEREAMRRLAPEVRTPELPEDPALRPAWLRRLVSAWPARLTREDESRAALYEALKLAQEARLAADGSVLDLGAYLAGLEQRLTVRPVTPESVGRVAQMHQRTNQFNLTTRRLGEAEIGAFAAGGESGMALVGRVADRFGDHGAVIAATARIDGEEAEIVTFLMSCRVIGREVERAFLGALLQALARRGVERVTGWFLPTAKNAIVRDFFAEAGFDRAEGRGGEANGETCWVFAFDGREFPQSSYVSMIVET